MAELTLKQVEEHGFNKQFAHRKCDTMASFLESEDKKKALFAGKFFEHALKKHDASQDTSANLSELANTILEALAPEAIGRQLVRIFEVGNQTKKVRKKTLGSADKTARGKSSRGKAGRSSFVVLNPQDEIESHDSWDLNTLEDLEWDVANDVVSDISEALKIEESQLIIDKLVAITAANTASKSLYNANTAGKFQYSDIVDMFTKLKQNNITADVLVINPAQLGDLLKDDKFINSTMLGDYVNINTGEFGKNILGVKVLSSSQVPIRTAMMFNTQNVLFYALRRDSMLENYQEVQDGDTTFGAKISSRYDLVYGDESQMIRCEDA